VREGAVGTTHCPGEREGGIIKTLKRDKNSDHIGAKPRRRNIITEDSDQNTQKKKNIAH